jgi:hypothetical protein
MFIFVALKNAIFSCHSGNGVEGEEEYVSLCCLVMTTPEYIDDH